MPNLTSGSWVKDPFMTESEGFSPFGTAASVLRRRALCSPACGAPKPGMHASKAPRPASKTLAHETSWAAHVLTFYAYP